MTKKRSIRRFIFLVLVVAIGIVLSIGGFKIPFTDKIYNGFANSISLGLDLSGGLAVVYDCEPFGSGDTNLNRSIDATITRLQDVLYSEGYSEATVLKQGSSRIRIEVPGADEDDNADIFSLIQDPQTLHMTLEQATDANPNPQIWLEGADISDVNVSYNNEESQFGVTLKFTKEGKTKFADLTREASTNNKTVYVYLGDVDASHKPWGSLSCETEITDGSTFISGGGISDYDSAKKYAYNIMSGTFNVKLTLVESGPVSATLGRNALLYGLIAGAVAIVLVMIIMWLRYGDFGLLANFALVIYLILMLFFLQAIPFVQLTLPGIAGIILSLGMAVDGNVIIFERIKEEYASGKKMHLAVKSGFKRAFWPIFDSNITTIFTSVILYFLGTAAIKGFAITLLLGILLSMFTSLVVTRYLLKIYLPLNTTKPSHAKLYRDKDVVEIIAEDEVSTTPTERGGQTNE